MAKQAAKGLARCRVAQECEERAGRATRARFVYVYDYVYDDVWRARRGGRQGAAEADWEISASRVTSR